jgi:hypothetical protein
MTVETFNTAKEIKDSIDKLNYEIKVMRDVVPDNTPIRFGGNFNVSVPISVDPKIMISFLYDMIAEKEKQVFELHEQFEKI